MKSLGFIIVLNLLGTLVCSQQIHFSRNYPFQLGSDYTGGVVQKTDSGFVFVSNIAQPGFVGYTFTETDKNGDTIYTKKYSFSTISFSLGGSHSLIKTNVGDYVQCGSGIDTSNNRQGYVIKFDSSGDTLWMKNYGGAGSDILNSVFQDSDSSLWLCGTTNSSGNGQDDFWLVVVDADGNIERDTVYGTSADEDLMTGDFTFDGGFILSGQRGSAPYVVKIDSLGSVDWTRSYSGYFGGGFITQLPDSHFVLGCNKPVGPDEMGIILNLDTGGAIVWFSSYVGFPLCTSAVYSKPILCADGIAVAGISLPDSPVATEGFLAKIDLNGNLLWQRMYTLNPNSSHHIYDFRSTSDGGFIMAGSCYLTNQDAWLIKVDSLGCDSVGCDGVSVTEQQSNTSLSVFPNPAYGNISIILSEVADGAYIEVLNSTGVLVDYILFNGLNSVTLSTQAYSEGIYFLRVMSNGDSIETEKIMIVK